MFLNSGQSLDNNQTIARLARQTARRGKINHEVTQFVITLFAIKLGPCPASSRTSSRSPSCYCLYRQRKPQKPLRLFCVFLLFSFISSYEWQIARPNAPFSRRLPIFRDENETKMDLCWRRFFNLILISTEQSLDENDSFSSDAGWTRKFHELFTSLF